jgi:Fe-S-cluster containining protein
MTNKNLVFKCDGCGKCCKFHWKINLKVNEIKKLEKLGFKKQDFVNINFNGPVLKFKNKKCFFLDDDNLCRIHKKFGYEYKPFICKKFPFPESICGIPKFSSKKPKNPSTKSDFFFRINNKVIYSKVFFKLFKKVDSSKPLFVSYCNLFLNILKQEDDILIDTFKLKDYNLKINKRLVKEFEDLLLHCSKDFFAGFKMFFKKEIVFDFPVEKIKVGFKNAELPLNLRKKILPFLYDALLFYESNPFFPLLLLFTLYFLPNFSKTLAKNPSKIKLLEVIRAFSLLNSLNRFPGPWSKPKCDNFNFINSKLPRFIKLKK